MRWKDVMCTFTTGLSFSSADGEGSVFDPIGCPPSPSSLEAQHRVVIAPPLLGGEGCPALLGIFFSFGSSSRLCLVK